MSINKAIRLTRMNIKENSKVELVCETRSGKRYTFPVVNCSLTGLAVRLPSNADSQVDWAADFSEDEIIPASKLVFDGTEATLGRLAIKRLPSNAAANTADGGGSIGFSTIDGKVPVDGALSRHFETNFDQKSSPYDYELSPNQFTIANFVGIDINNIDIFDRTRKFGVFYENWQRSEKFGYFMERDKSQGARVKLTRRRSNGRTDYIMMGSNDYLGLASHPEVKEAAIQAIRDFGFGSTGSSHTSGYSIYHEQLEKKIAQMFGKEDAILYTSGYTANVGIISGLCREQDLIIADQLAHASIHDGINMSRANCRLFKHNDMAHLEKILVENRDQFGGCLIATEGAFSMDGTIGKLDEIHRLARKYNARVMIDQAHCVGVVGQHGLGTVEKYNLIGETDMIMGLFSKSLGSVGGYLAADADICNWLRSFSRAYIFATSFPPCTAASTLKAIELMQTEDLVPRLQANIRHFVSNLRQIGAPVSPQHETAIVPLEIRDEVKMGKMYQILLDSGVFVMPVVYPVVSRNRCRFRFSLRADLTVSDLDYVVSAVERAMKAADFSFSEVQEDSKKAA